MNYLRIFDSSVDKSVYSLVPQIPSPGAHKSQQGAFELCWRSNLSKHYQQRMIAVFVLCMAVCFDFVISGYISRKEEGM